MNTIERHVFYLIGEDPDNPDVFIDDDTGIDPIRDSVNDAIEEIAMLTGTYQDRCFLPMRESRMFYKLEFNGGQFAWITDVWALALKRRLEQTSIIRLNHHNPRWLMDSGTVPQAYFPIGFKHIGLWPKPASDVDLLEVRGVIVPARYTDQNDRIKLRDDYEWAAAHYATGEFFASRGDAKRAIFHHQQYLEKMGVYLQYPMAAEYVPYYRTEKEPQPKATD